MADFKDKLSHLISQQAPDFVLEDHPYFLEFVKEYYKFLESAEMTLTNIGDPDHIQLETQTETNNFLQLSGTNQQRDDNGDRILLEDTSYGDFINGETITGQTSGATATVLVEDIDGGSRLFVSHQNKFEVGELIVGSTSGAEATIATYKANPVQNIQQLLDYPDPDKTIQSFLTKFRNAFLQSIPDSLGTGVDKRKLIKNIKSLYRAKGTKRASEIFFKLLFNENAEIRFPKENILRASDGKWDTQSVVRCLEVGSSNATNLIGQTITQANVVSDPTINEATAIVENVFKYQIGGETVVELILGEDSISGTFVAGQNITGTDNTDADVLITCLLKGVINSKTISNDGSFYNEGDIVSILGGGNDANIQVDAIGSGEITEVLVDNGGSGYEIGDTINFSFGNATAAVSVVNGGITQDDSTSSTDDHIILEDETVRGDPYTGNKIVQESGTGSGDITDVRMIYKGNGYTSLPTLTVTSSGGSSASIFSYGPEIGRVLKLKTIELGSNYELSPTPPTLTLPTYLLLSNRSGSFTVGETITGLDLSSTVITATVVSLDTNTNILKCSGATGTFAENTNISGGTSLQTATVYKTDQATATSTVAALTTTDGRFINQDGWISENSMLIQDSLLYQDYSYIIRVGRSINDWRDTYTKTLHSAGFYFQGEVGITTQLNNRLRSVTGINSGVTEDIFAVYKTIFSTILGRRLGTATDGTSLRANPALGVGVDLTDSTSEHFTVNTRDLTLRAAYVLKSAGGIVKETTSIRGNTTKFGVPTAGPTLKSLNELILSQNFANQVTIEQLSNLTLQGTQNTSIDGESTLLSDFNFKLKTSFAIPSEVWQISQDSFDEDRDSFDTTGIKFDAA